MFVCLKGLGKFRKSKDLWSGWLFDTISGDWLSCTRVTSYWWRGCFMLMSFKVVTIFKMWMFIVNLQKVLL